MVSEDILEEKNKRLSNKKDLVSEDIYWEKKKTITNKRLWRVRTHFWDEKKSLANGEDILEEKNKRLSKKKGLVSEDIY